MAVDIYSPKFMLQLVEQAVTLKTPLRDTFFPRVRTFPTNTVEFDVKKRGMSMAPFVHPRIGSKVMERSGYKTMSYKPPLVAPKRVLTTDDVEVRLAGESQFSGRSGNYRRVALLRDDLVELDEAITRREEWMCAHALFEGEIPVVGEGINEVISFDFENKLIAEVSWLDYENANPIKDLEKGRKLASRSGYSANVAIGSSATMWAIMENEKVQKFLDNRNMNMGVIAPALLENGMTYIGFLRKANLHCYAYDGEYADNDNENPKYPGVKPEDKGFIPAVYPLVPDGKVLIAPSGNFPSRMLYAVIHDLQIGSQHRRRVPKQWDQEEPSEKFLKLSSKPLPCPQNLDVWTILEVFGNYGVNLSNLSDEVNLGDTPWYLASEEYLTKEELLQLSKLQLLEYAGHIGCADCDAKLSVKKLVKLIDDFINEDDEAEEGKPEESSDTEEKLGTSE
ncbi:MAG: major capsid protein [Oscillospiraceae bacterium]|nr:major capsid protein [Oscillospiraceae bacterium]